MMLLETLHKSIDHVSTSTAIKAGAAGSGVSIMAAVIDPVQIELWMRIATLGVGFLTGIGSLVLVGVKVWDRLFSDDDRH